ncbi:MAG TPA: formylglycine-generating enzyme family protein, partial [Stellaceae bacterium]|nr:formylglycine-generating enzyme family protein [Stellaceae bacterium]
GDHKVKNITDPVRVYRVLPDPAAVARVRRSRRQALAAAGVAAVLIAGAAYWLTTAAPEALRKPPTSGSSAAQPIATTRPPPPAAPAPGDNGQRRIAVTPPPIAAPAIKGAEMVSLPGGSFVMGSNEDASEKPIHRVTIAPFSIGRYPVTVGDWKGCVAATACPPIAAGDDKAPMTDLSWDDAIKFVAWMRGTRNENYRLPTEAEWEYAARGGTKTRYWWGNEAGFGMADCKGCGEPYNARAPLAVGSFPPNPFGLHDMGGAVAEWVSDCWHHDYVGAPADGASWEEADCDQRVLRGGSWENDANYLRTASRDSYDASVRYPTHGFRLARSP